MNYDKYYVEVYGMTSDTKQFEFVFVMDLDMVDFLEYEYGEFFGFSVLDDVGIPKDRISDIEAELDYALETVGRYI